MGELITYIGLDVHKDTIAVALAEAGKRGEVREHGQIANTPTALKTLGAKLARGRNELRFCYEAGPCGYGIQRQLTAAGHECVVVAPSLIPRKPGDRIKTDRRDASSLAKLHREGELTAVWVPGVADIRELRRHWIRDQVWGAWDHPRAPLPRANGDAAVAPGRALHRTASAHHLPKMADNVIRLVWLTQEPAALRRFCGERNCPALREQDGGRYRLSLGRSPDHTKSTSASRFIGDDSVDFRRRAH